MPKLPGLTFTEERMSDAPEKSHRKSRDPLGKLQQHYEVTLAVVLGFCGGVAVIGAGALIWGLTQASLGWQIFGGVVLLIACVLVGINIPNLGRRLEVRRRGVRFIERGESTEFHWDDIAEVELDRTDSTYLGVATVRERSSDERKPSGLLSNTELDVTIRSHDGRSIRLRPTFLRLVPKPRELITEIKVRAGLM